MPRVITLPTKPEPINRERWAESVHLRLTLNELQRTLKCSEKALRRLRKSYEDLERKWIKDRNDMLASLARGAEIEGGGRIAVVLAAAAVSLLG
ncbi:MAG TPA: hypothetical protein VN442_11110 [Bryobacteraceae bacterium]|nr:hypothetical protein [Bryobacteraceae bacterium]